MVLCSCPMLISRVVVDNRSTISYYSHEITCLDQLMTKVNYNITAFNNEVQNIVYCLQSRDESMQHLKMNLFKGYKAPTDKEFMCIIHLKKYEYNEGVSIDAHKLMSHTENQYIEIIGAKEWHTPPKENQEILAINAEIKALKEQYINGEGGNNPRNLDRSKNAWKKVAPKN